MPEIVNGPSQGASNNYQNFIKNSRQNNKKKFIAFIGVLLLVIALPVILLVIKIPQEIRQRASSPNANFNLSQYTSCGTAPADIMMIFDTSGSMGNTLGNSKVTKLQAAQTAGSAFVDIISTNTLNHVGLTNFSSTSTLDSKLVTNYSSVKSQINGLKASGTTCTQCGAKTGDDELHADGRVGFKKVAILLTDGIANTIIGSSKQVGTPAAEAAAITEIQNAYNSDQITYFTIGLGNRNGNIETGIDEPFLQEIAKITGGQYYYSPSTNDLNQIYQNIATIIGKGSISGTVYNDSNNNGTFDSNEQGLNNWTVNLKDPTNTNVIATTQSDSDGSYVFNGVCDQSYAVSEVVQSGWSQTDPPPPGYYPVTIKNGSVVKDKNFGNTQSTPTACVTPDPIQNVQIMCTNCSGNGSSQ